MRITLRQLRNIIREAVAKELDEIENEKDESMYEDDDMDESWSSAYSNRYNRHGDSVEPDDEPKEQEPYMSAEERKKRDEERDEWSRKNQTGEYHDTGWND